MANFRADPTKARSSKVRKTLNQGRRKFKQKAACGLPQNLQKLSRAKKYDAMVTLSAMPITVRIVSKTKAGGAARPAWRA
jgi:septation ring formation regulator EzrA